MNDKFMEGDKVVVRSDDLCDYRYRLGKVEAVTPSGQIRLTDKSRFLPNGYRIGEVSEHILPATEENLIWYREQELRANIRQRCKVLTTQIGRLKLCDLERAWAAICQVTGEANAELVDSRFLWD